MLSCNIKIKVIRNKYARLDNLFQELTSLTPSSEPLNSSSGTIGGFGFGPESCPDPDSPPGGRGGAAAADESDGESDGDAGDDAAESAEASVEGGSAGSCLLAI